MTTKSSPSGGIGVLGALGVAFVVLKLLGYIDWPWIWVLAPFWSGFAMLALIFVGAFIYAASKVRK